jgi:hypothetical protein
MINPPQPQHDGTIRLSGNGSPGSFVVIYSATDPGASYWQRDVTVTVPPSGQWAVTRPGTVGGARLFYRAEMRE